MATTQKTLSGRTGWSAVVGLSTVFAVLVAGQLPASSSFTPSFAPVAATATSHATTSAGDRLPGPIRGTALRATAPVAVRAPAAPAKPTAAAPAKAATRATVAKPALAAGMCSGAGWQQRRGSAALASLKAGALDRTGFRIEFKAARSGYMGLTHLNERRIEVFVRDCGKQSDELLRHVMAHELGHAYDTVRNNAAVRAAWQAARGIPASTPWYGCSGCTDFATPAGDFAEVYAQWARGASSNRSQLSGDVAPAALTALAGRFLGA